MENTKVYVLHNGYGGVTHASTNLDEILEIFKVENYDLYDVEESYDLENSCVLTFDKTGVVDEMYVYIKSRHEICRANHDMEIIEEDVKSNVHHSSQLQTLFTDKDGCKCEMAIPKDYKKNPEAFIKTILESSEDVVKGEFLEIHTYRRAYGEILKDEVGK